MNFATLSERDPAMVRLAQQVAAKLVGTPESGPEAIIERYFEGHEGAEDNPSFLHEFDRLVFCCTKCDWWFDQNQNANPGYGHDEPWMCHECKAESASG